MSASGSVESDRVHVASLTECYAHTDLEWRLTQIPDEATCRGAFFGMLADRAHAFGPGVEHEYRRLFPTSDQTAFRMYPVRDYLTRIVVLSQIRYGAENIPAGLRQLQASAFDAWGGTMLGRAAMTMVERRPAPILRMLERAYTSRTVNSHANLILEVVEPKRVVVRFEHEYLYIESAMVGALEGVARLCGLRPTSNVELRGPFDGTVTMELEP